MNPTDRIFIVNNIKLPVNASFEEAFSVAKDRARKAGISSPRDFRIYRRSTDARRKDAIVFVYSVSFKANGAPRAEKLSRFDISVSSAVEEIKYEIGSLPLTARPVVVGSGPAGIFAALILAERGYFPIVLERGGSVSERLSALECFRKTRILNTETNIQFGAGGAGTFSDGKLVTRINDPLCSYVLRRFVEFGAPEQILYVAKPHIGTDILLKVVDNVLTYIEALGGKILYNTRFENFSAMGGDVLAVNTSKGEIKAGALVLAVGHSARDTYKTLIDKGVALEAKSFSVGMRIEHLAEDIDTALYGDMAGNSSLGHAEYNLSDNTKERGVYTFCMCPGGEVVAATSEEGGVVVNGMSKYKRDGKNSNSAVCCTVFKEDFDKTPLGAIEYQRNIERKAFIAGGSDYSAPIITVGDFISGKIKNEPKRIMPTYMSGGGVRLAMPDEYLPRTVTDAIRAALSSFDKKIHGFAASDAVFTGAETRTSAPVRILRSAEERTALGYSNFYPAGEGAGYAGGITSAAVDGIKTALALMKKYMPNEQQ